MLPALTRDPGGGSADGVRGPASLHHIELLTGQPSMTVRGFMRRAGIPLRHPGGRTPILRRWREISRAPA